VCFPCILSRSRSDTASRYPCDTPLHPVSVLAASNDGIFSQLDFSGISSDYASKTGIYAPEMAAERARKCRLWLRDRPEAEIVGVSFPSGRGGVADQAWLWRTGIS